MNMPLILYGLGTRLRGDRADLPLSRKYGFENMASQHNSNARATNY